VAFLAGDLAGEDGTLFVTAVATANIRRVD
jgi:hypothetical protein